MNIFRLRRTLYRTAAVLGDAQAVTDSVRTRSAKPVAKRVARKAVYRTEGRLTRKALRQFGL